MTPFTCIWPLADSVESGGWLAVYEGSQGKYEHAGNDRIKRNGPTLGAELIACQEGYALVNHEGDGWGSGSFGSCVRIDHPQGDGSFWSIAAHLQRDSIAVKTGDFVKQGQPIGYAGMTGLTTGPHVHFAIQRGGGGNFDPARFLFEGVWKLGNKQIVDPGPYIVAPPTISNDAIYALLLRMDARGEQTEISLNNLNKAFIAMRDKLRNV